jgi:DNA (cytosine-5)-methyltransferase 1
MPKKKRRGQTIDPELRDDIERALDGALGFAEDAYSAGSEPQWALSGRFLTALDQMSAASNQASTAFTNVVTSIAIKAARPQLDIRVHQVQIGSPFSFRDISERVIYPWLRDNEFEGAKSGWQTRTFERPRPFTMDFPENIAVVKQPFLICYDEIESAGGDAATALRFLLYRQLRLRESKRIELATPAVDSIASIIDLFQSHFFYSYKTKGAARLPVLSLSAVYEVMVHELKRYEGKRLRPLQSHAAADSQTGALGDIEVESGDGTVFEAVEVKHNLRITPDLVEDAARKIAPFRLGRYYLLTSHADCQPDATMQDQLHDKHIRIGTQIIVNGVIPTLKYYLRLLRHPGDVFPHYVRLLKTDAAVAHEHRRAWNDIVAGDNPPRDARRRN